MKIYKNNGILIININFSQYLYFFGKDLIIFTL